MPSSHETKTNSAVFTVMPKGQGKFMAPARQPNSSKSAVYTPSTPSPLPPTLPPNAPSSIVIPPPVQPPVIQSSGVQGNLPVQSSTQEYKPKRPLQWKIILQVLAFLTAGALFAGAGYYGWGWWQGQQTQEALVDADNDAKTQEQVTPTPEPTEEEVVEVVPTPDPNAGWFAKYFGTSSCTVSEICGDEADPDKDGLKNLKEREVGTDPNNRDSDSDGLSDGDEVQIFGGSPLTARTSASAKYTDADDARGGYNSQTGKEWTAEEKLAIGGRIKQFGLHMPTLDSLLGFLEQYGASGNGTTPIQLDSSPEAKLERDMQRVGTIKKVGIALHKYYEQTGSFPAGTSFSDMLVKIKPYNLVATSSQDPVNSGTMVFQYKELDGGKDFEILYFSETQNQLMRYNASQASRDSSAQSAAQTDESRIIDLENMRQALLIYVAAKSAGGEKPVYPSVSELENALVPAYLQGLPKDAKTGKVYEYQTSPDRSSFLISANLENPPTGTTRYVCDPDGCLGD